MPDNDLRWIIVYAERECKSEREKLKFDCMLEDHKKGLYPNCKDDNTKLGTTLELLQWKAENGVSDKGFEKLLKIMKNKLALPQARTLRLSFWITAPSEKLSTYQIGREHV